MQHREAQTAEEFHWERAGRSLEDEGASSAGEAAAELEGEKPGTQGRSGG